MSIHNFTLIELFWGIAITAIPAAMLYLGVAASLRIVVTASCMSRVRKISIGYIGCRNTFAYTPKVYIDPNSRWDALAGPCLEDKDNKIYSGVCSNLALRHNTGFNAAFFDGHAEYSVYKNML